jgi:hypothetical protein
MRTTSAPLSESVIDLRAVVEEEFMLRPCVDHKTIPPPDDQILRVAGNAVKDFSRWATR